MVSQGNTPPNLQENLACWVPSVGLGRMLRLLELRDITPTEWARLKMTVASLRYPPVMEKHGEIERYQGLSFSVADHHVF